MGRGSAISELIGPRSSCHPGAICESSPGCADERPWLAIGRAGAKSGVW